MQGRTENLPGPRDDFDSTVFDAGIGYLQPITTHMLLRAEVRYRTDDKGSMPTGSQGTTSNIEEGVYSIGLLFPLGGNAVRPGKQDDAAPAVVATESADEDNEGDNQDRKSDARGKHGTVRVEDGVLDAHY